MVLSSKIYSIHGISPADFSAGLQIQCTRAFLLVAVLFFLFVWAYQIKFNGTSERYIFYSCHWQHLSYRSPFCFVATTNSSQLTDIWWLLWFSNRPSKFHFNNCDEETPYRWKQHDTQDLNKKSPTFKIMIWLFALICSHLTKNYLLLCGN